MALKFLKLILRIVLWGVWKSWRAVRRAGGNDGIRLEDEWRVAGAGRRRRSRSVEARLEDEMDEEDEEDWVPDSEGDEEEDAVESGSSSGEETGEEEDEVRFAFILLSDTASYESTPVTG